MHGHCGDVHLLSIPEEVVHLHWVVALHIREDRLPHVAGSESGLVKKNNQGSNNEAPWLK